MMRTRIAERYIPVGNVRLAADFTIPTQAVGLVVTAHGSGSSRLSPRNKFVSRLLNEVRLATLLMDLMTPDEEEYDEQTRALRFNIPFLARRLIGVLAWVHAEAEPSTLPIGLFGASTGAAAALIAAAREPDLVRAVVSRGGRPDLAGAETLRAVRAPTLLIVGGHDPTVLDLNREALRSLREPSDLVVVPRATHLFEEPGALEEVAAHAQRWFLRYLAST